MTNRHLARTLRKNQTDAERMMWRRLRNRQCKGYKFRRQMPIGTYIVDFACIELKIIVEIDGAQHQERVEFDERRTACLESIGYTVVRFWNNEVLEHIDAVLESLTLIPSRRERELASLRSTGPR